MQSMISRITSSARRKFLASALAVALAAGVGVLELAKPVRAASPAPAAPALDDNSVGALLAFDKAMENLAAHVTPAVVNVAVTSKASNTAMAEGDDNGDDDNPMSQFFGQQFGFPRMRPQQPQIEHGVGSGVIISPDGYIVTNNHVVDGAVNIRVTTSDKRVWDGKVVGTDPLTDLAVIKINGTNLPSIPWGNSSNLKPGQLVLAFGNPMGFRFTVTRGIVSALNRPNPFGKDPRQPGGFIQTDAAINPGNSGGALVNARGELVGINTFLVSATGGFSGMGFAIPSQLAQHVADSLARNGKVVHPRVGIGISDVTPENAQFFNLKDASGALVTQVDSDSPASRAGLKVGDVVKKMNDTEITDATQFQVAVQEQQVGNKVNMEIVRDGQHINVPVTLEAMDAKKEMASNGPGEHGKARWGIGLADLTSDAREQLQLPNDVHGALVAQVQPGSPADNAGLSRGDVIVQVNRKDVKSASDVKQSLNNVPAGKDALLLVYSRGGNSFRVLHPEQQPS